MNALLGRIGLPKAVGVYVGQDSVSISQVVAAPWGLIETHHDCLPTGDDDPADAVGQLLAPLAGGIPQLRVQVALGIPTGQTYFSTRPVQSAGNVPSPNVLLRESLQSSRVSVEEMQSDVVKAQPERRAVAGIVACDRKHLTKLLSRVEQVGARVHRAEPAACALLRLAQRAQRDPRDANVVLRVFLGEQDGLAILVAGKRPIVWREFKLTRGDEAAAVLSVARALSTMGKHGGVESNLDIAILHGRAELARLLDVEWLEDQLQASVNWRPRPLWTVRP